MSCRFVGKMDYPIGSGESQGLRNSRENKPVGKDYKKKIGQWQYTKNPLISASLAREAMNTLLIPLVFAGARSQTNLCINQLNEGEPYEA